MAEINLLEIGLIAVFIIAVMLVIYLAGRKPKIPPTQPISNEGIFTITNEEIQRRELNAR